MTKRIVTIALISLLALICLWCGGFFPVSRNTIGWDGVWFSLAGPKVGWESKKDGFVYETRYWTLKFEDCELFLNGRSHGKVSQGDDVAVSWTGVLTVNGTVREASR